MDYLPIAFVKTAECDMYNFAHVYLRSPTDAEQITMIFKVQHVQLNLKNCCGIRHAFLLSCDIFFKGSVA